METLLKIGRKNQTYDDLINELIAFKESGSSKGKVNKDATGLETQQQHQQLPHDGQEGQSLNDYRESRY
jgi:hypothetical protein